MKSNISLLFEYFIERRASRIVNPVERLRYLREAKEQGFLASMGWSSAGGLARLAIGCLAILLFSARTVSDASGTRPPNSALPATVWAEAAPGPVHNVWLIDKTVDAEFYSNGLRIERRFVTTSEPRRYRVFPRSGIGEATGWRTTPAGIVFHTSESDLAPLEPGQTRVVKRQGVDLLQYAQRHNWYHFVIDRFGRVFRILEETDKADHSGQSLWADRDWIYVNVNSSFLGVAFEARSESEGERPPVNAAQLQAGRNLTDMLRAQYGIPAGNCVTHAQVSVNPSNFRVGYHTDWAANFPFAELGLPDNYGQPLPSVSLFGFAYDPIFVEAAGARLREGLSRASAALERDAAARKIPAVRERTILRQRYKEIRAAVLPAEEER